MELLLILIIYYNISIVYIYIYVVSRYYITTAVEVGLVPGKASGGNGLLRLEKVEASQHRCGDVGEFVEELPLGEG